MKLIGWHETVEKGVGWVHELLFEDETGGKILVIDDTDTVEVYATPGHAIDQVATAGLWEANKMGTSEFNPDLRITEYRGGILGDKTIAGQVEFVFDILGEDLSHYA